MCWTVPHVLICYVIGEESWVFWCIADMKHQSMEWQTESFAKVEEQTIFEHFSWATYDLQTIFAWRKNIKFCYRCWKVYWSMFWEGGHNFEGGGGHLRFLLRDNTRAHSAMITKCMLASCGMLVISRPLYSPFLVPSDFFCSWMWKPSLKEKDFRTSRTSVM